jgi:hypothetical protein
MLARKKAAWTRGAWDVVEAQDSRVGPAVNGLIESDVGVESDNSLMEIVCLYYSEGFEWGGRNIVRMKH